MSRVSLIVFPIVLIYSFVSVGCNPSAILGPSNKPEFESLELVQMELIYWVKVADQKKDERQLVVRDVNVLQQGFDKLEIKRIDGYSLAVNEQILLKTSSGIEWTVSVVFSDRFDFGLKSDPYYAYNVYTKNDQFYEWLLDISRSDANQVYPGIGKESIVLRSNLSLKAYKIYEGRETGGASGRHR